MAKIIKTFNGGSWIRNSKMTSFEDCDIVVMPGGSDIGSEIYNHNPIRGGFYRNTGLNLEQINLVKKAIKHNKFVFGVCKGLQILTAINGGGLYKIYHIHHLM